MWQGYSFSSNLFSLCFRLTACVPEINNFDAVIQNTIDNLVQMPDNNTTVQKRTVSKIRFRRAKVRVLTEKQTNMIHLILEVFFPFLAILTLYVFVREPKCNLGST